MTGVSDRADEGVDLVVVQIAVELIQIQELQDAVDEHDDAGAGDPTAQMMLGTRYLKGFGVPQDHQLAYFWSSLAVSRLPVGLYRSFAVMDRDEATNSLTPYQLAEAQRLTREWRPKEK